MIDYLSLKKMPKVELHLHLDGSVRVKTLEEYYQKDIKQQVIAPDKCLDLENYLTKFLLPVSYLQEKEHIERVCYELSKDLENDGVIYAEVRFSPVKLAESHLSLEEVVEAAICGFKKGNIKVSLILCMMRNDSFDVNKRVIDLAIKYLDKGVVALDLAGDEKKYETATFQELFSIIKEKGIPFTIHAGEINNCDSLHSALGYGAKRLGHGIHSINYPEIIEEIKNNQILLEVCPTSNVQTNAVSDYASHPIQKLKEAGCMLCISTDNRVISNITLTEEYEKLANTFHFTEKDFCDFNLMAINHSFLKESEKEKYRKIIREYLNHHK